VSVELKIQHLYKIRENTSTKWGFGGGEAAPELLFLVLRPGEAGAQHQKTKVIKRSWYQYSTFGIPNTFEK